MGEQEEESGYGVSQIVVGRESDSRWACVGERRLLVLDWGQKEEGRRVDPILDASSAHSKAYFNIPLRSKTLNLKQTIPPLTYVLEKL
ncbi:hypothetical protein K435DRAFT_876907 [Dendrothele bispora CBS 962.96]|uniref:Uncharacterized protein n=1 Tax=Dendrothele bispora (strain CBS 962.96) TaxID=1314807 RepID=A0A4S8KR50_DENBC|nr:hypothetical protein K435DRAFT_876907 [Dendrothele bispora CBS 962.96]